MGKIKDLTGKRFGRLRVVSFSHTIKYEKSTVKIWNCICDCGNETMVRSCDLRSGNTKSCGCYYKENIRLRKIKHLESKTRLYSIYIQMKYRCVKKNHISYKYYGGKGIVMCDEWIHDYNAFKEWALNNGYSDDLTIDRIDNNKGYFPDNCRFASSKEQARNRTTSHFIELNGETKTIAEWAEIKKISRTTLQSRIGRYKWDYEKAINTPVKQKKSFI